jgi:small GTP-binding protein
MSGPSDSATFRVVVVGDSEAGKTSIIYSLIRNDFDSNLRSTIGATFHTISREVRNRKITIQLWDTAGQEKYRSIGPAYYRNVAAAIAVFDLTFPNFSQSLESWIVNVKRTADDPMIFIVGNKSDLPFEDAVVVRMQQLSQQYDAQCLMTSAKTGQNVDLLFDHLFLALAKSCEPQVQVITNPAASSSQDCC